MVHSVPILQSAAVACMAVLLANSSGAQSVLSGRMTRSSLNGSLRLPYSRVLVGDLTPDARLDSLCMGGGEIGVIDGAESHGALLRPFTLGAEILDVVIIKGVGFSAPDAIAALSRNVGTGMVTLERLDYERDFTTGDVVFSSTVLEQSAWNSVTKLAVGDLDGDGWQEILGLEGRLVHRIEITPGGPQVAVDTPLLVPATEIRTGPWGVGPADAVFAVAPDHIQVLDAAGTPIDRIDAFTGQLTDFDTWRGTQGGRMAVISKEVATNTSWIQVFGETGYQEPRQTLGIVDPIHIVAADFSGNGHSDVGLLNRYDSILIWFLNSGGPPPDGSYVTFSTSDVSRAYGEFFPIAPAVSMDSQSGQAVAADFDGDGDMDMAFACDATEHFHVKRNPFVLEADRMCGGLDVTTGYRDHPVHPAPLGGLYSDVGAEADLAILLPADTEGHTHVELIAYQVDLGARPEAAAHEVHEISSLGTLPVGQEVFRKIPTMDLMGHYRELVLNSLQDEAEYLVVVRLLTFAGTTIQSAGVEATFTFKHQRTYGVDEDGVRGDRPIIGTPSPPTPVADAGTPPPRKIPPPPTPPASSSSGN